MNAFNWTMWICYTLMFLSSILTMKFSDKMSKRYTNLINAYRERYLKSIEEKENLYQENLALKREITQLKSILNNGKL
jgi:predicted S18 family serine protease